MSVAIGASAAGARAYTATASQGLLYMAEALYNASGLGLPIVMTVANRAIGAPINIWNDHSDSMSQRDSRLDPALRRDQPGGGRPAHPGLPAGRGGLAAGDGLHGRLRAHPRRRARSTARSAEQVDAFLPPFEPRAGARPGRPGDDRGDGRPGGVLRGPLPGARQADAGARPDPGDRRRVRAAFGRASGGLVRGYRIEDAETIVVALGSVLGTIEEVVDELRDAGPADRRAGDQVVPALPARGGPRGAGAAPSGSSSSRRRSRSGSAGSSRPTCAWRSRASSSTGTRVIAGLGGRPITRRSLRGLLAEADGGRARAAQLPRPRPRAGRARAERLRAGAAGRPARREHAPRPRHRRREAALRERRRRRDATRQQELKFYQVGHASRSATGCSTPSSAPCRPHRPLQRAHLRPPRLPGLRRGARRALRARRGDARQRRPADRRQRDRLPRGLLDARTRSRRWQLPWIHSLFGNAPAVATGIAAALRAKGARGRPRDRPGRRRRHARHRLRLPVGDVRAQRRRALRLLRQRGLHEHRRAALRRDPAGGPHGDHQAGRAASPATSSGRARTRR